MERLLQPAAPQRAVHIALGAAYVVLVVLGWGRDALPGIPDPHPRAYTHVTPLLFWVFWLSLLVLTVPAVGRAWCGVCPLGAVSDAIGRRGLGLPWPRWLARGWGALAVFLGGVAVVMGGKAHLSPHATALLAAGVGSLAILASVLWRRSAFCRGLCPVGKILGLYARPAMLRIGPRDRGQCNTCACRRCVATLPEWRRTGRSRWVVFRRQDRGGCPVALDPLRMDTTRCLLCLRCVRQCPYKNLTVFAGNASRTLAPLDPVRTVFLGIATGLVGIALLRTWPAVASALTPGILPPAWWQAVWIGAVLPAALLFGPALAEGALRTLEGTLVRTIPPGPEPGPEPGHPNSAFQDALTILPSLVGPVLGAHAALALVKLNAKAGYLPYIFYDPLGAETYLAIHVGRILPLPDLLIPARILRWLALGAFAAGAVWGLKELGGTARNIRRFRLALLYAVSWGALVAGFGSVLWHWLGAAG